MLALLHGTLSGTTMVAGGVAVRHMNGTLTALLGAALLNYRHLQRHTLDESCNADKQSIGSVAACYEQYIVGNKQCD